MSFLLASIFALIYNLQDHLREKEPLVRLHQRSMDKVTSKRNAASLTHMVSSMLHKGILGIESTTVTILSGLSLSTYQVEALLVKLGIFFGHIYAYLGYEFVSLNPYSFIISFYFSTFVGLCMRRKSWKICKIFRIKVNEVFNRLSLTNEQVYSVAFIFFHY